MITLGDLAVRAGLSSPDSNEDLGIRDATHDSREVGPGFLFVALAGAASDGHDFLAEAASRGAAAALVATARLKDARAAAPGLPLLHCADPRAALAAVAAAVFGAPRLDLVGVTGTNGKTTTAYLLRDILRATGRRPALLGTIAYDLGRDPRPAPNTTPDALVLRRALAEAEKNGCDAAVLEVSSHALALGRVAGLTFRAAAFTNLTQDHLDFHSDMEDYFRAKRSLFTDHLSAEGPRAVVFLGDDFGARLASELGPRALTVSIDRPADLTAEATECDLDGSRFILRASPRARALGAKDGARMTLRLLGRTNVANALTALAMALTLGLDFATIRAALADASPIPGRFEIVSANAPFRIVVDYAHTPDALERLLETGRALSPRRLVAVFGCGGDRDPKKRPIMGAIAARLADRVVVTSDNPRTEDPERILDEVLSGVPAAAREKVTRIGDRRAAIRRAVSEAGEGELLLIAGKGHEDYQILGRTKHPFDDRVEAANAIREMAAARAPFGAAA